MDGLRIFVCKYEREVKCFHCGLDSVLSAEGNALGNTAHQRGLDVERLCGQLTYVKEEEMRQCLPYVHHQARGSIRISAP